MTTKFRAIPQVDPGDRLLYSIKENLEILMGQRDALDGYISIADAEAAIALAIANMTTHYSIEADAALFGKINRKDAINLHIMGSRTQGWVNTSDFGDACEYLDTSQSNMNTPTSGQTLYLVSTSANDAAAGSGARTVKTTYLDASGNQLTRTDTLNGTNPVSIGTGYTFIQWMEVATNGSAGAVAAGKITISSTNGAATVATTFEQITAGGNRSLSGRYKIPTGYTGYMSNWTVAAISATMDTRLRADCFAGGLGVSAGVFHFNARLFLASGQNQQEVLPYLKLPATTVIKVSAIPGSAPAGNKLDCAFNLLLVKN